MSMSAEIMQQDLRLSLRIMCVITTTVEGNWKVT
jgi:hypothetical protein